MHRDLHRRVKCICFFSEHCFTNSSSAYVHTGSKINFNLPVVSENVINILDGHEADFCPQLYHTHHHLQVRLVYQ